MAQGSRGMVVMVGLMGATGAAMLAPAALGFALRELAAARAFIYSACLLFALAGMIHLANRNRPAPRHALAHPFYTLALAYAVVPLMMALPLTEAVPGGLGLFDAWVEMVAAFTTTGTSALPADMPATVTLWRGIAGWMGGAAVLVFAAGLLAPLNMGGFDIVNARDRPAPMRALRVRRKRDMRAASGFAEAAPSRLWTHVKLVMPAYAGVTLGLWVALAALGTAPRDALMLAMATLATSGIVPDGAGYGRGAEMLVALVLVLALTRRLWPGAPVPQDEPPLHRDAELRLAALLLAAVTLALALAQGRALAAQGLPAALDTLWAMLFTTLSFLTTAGFTAQPPAGAAPFAGATGIVLLGLAMVGGGVATTAGGLKLLRVFALLWQGKHELERLVHPSGMGGDGPRLRGLRGEGAFAAWLFLMVFILTLTALIMALVLQGLVPEHALIHAVAALTTTGPLVLVAGPEPLAFAALDTGARAVLAFGMILGRLELLLLLSVLWPQRGG